MTNKMTQLNEADISLALSFFKNKGVYALLLGSGVSRSAGIPTGWEIITHLMKQIAVLHDINFGKEADLESWYKTHYGDLA